MALLAVGNDAKTVKGKKAGYLTGILYLSPERSHGLGVNLCPFATEGCKRSCLNTAGRGAFNSVQQGRNRKTRLYLADRSAFLAQLDKDIAALVRKAKREGMSPAVRLNGTSDLSVEKWTDQQGQTLMSKYPMVAFYDYTKNPHRYTLFLSGALPANYHLTFSWSETEAGKSASIRALENGGTVAVAFHTRKGAPLPATFLGFPVLDGDETDLRMFDPAGHVVGLRAKGKAKQDTSGFVVKGE